MIYVFGSNLLGIHGKGGALYAKQNHGAVQGVGRGRTGNAYALPTKKTPYIYMNYSEVAVYVAEFIQHAIDNPDDTFYVPAIGTGNAGFTIEQISELFKEIPSNITLCEAFKQKQNNASLDDFLVDSDE